MDHRIPRTPPSSTRPLQPGEVVRETDIDATMAGSPTRQYRRPVPPEEPPRELPACAVCELPIRPDEKHLDLPQGAGKIHVAKFDPEEMILTGPCAVTAFQRGLIPSVYRVPEEAVRNAEYVPRDDTDPHGPWEFDQDVTDAFEDMLSRSIPWYDNMRAIVTDLAAYFVPRGHAGGGIVTDLGASRGDGLQPIIDVVGAHARYHAVEVSESMLSVLRERWPSGRRDETVSGLRVQVHDFDLRKGYPAVPPASVTLCVLTLQFTPMEHRQRILRDVYRHTQPGGALILVEKVLGATAEIDDLLVRRYYAMKGENGYSQDQIERKRLSLEGVLVPCTAAWDEELLQQAGFREVDCFWRWCNFAGWVAVRTD